MARAEYELRFRRQVEARLALDQPAIVVPPLYTR